MKATVTITITDNDDGSVATTATSSPPFPAPGSPLESGAQRVTLYLMNALEARLRRDAGRLLDKPSKASAIRDEILKIVRDRAAEKGAPREPNA